MLRLVDRGMRDATNGEDTAPCPAVIRTVVVTPFSQNCRIIADRAAGVGAVFDPGGDVSAIIGAIEGLNLSLGVRTIVLSHAHIDHAGGVHALSRWLENEYGEVELLAHKNEREMRASICQQALMFGLSPRDYENVREPDRYLDEGDQVAIGGLRLRVLFTPGHAPGHLSFYLPAFCRPELVCGSRDKATRFDLGTLTGLDGEAELFSPAVIAGDTLFAGSIGRTDLPGGNHATLIRSIREKILTLPDDTVVMSGHGPDTLVGLEKRSNPFLT